MESIVPKRDDTQDETPPADEQARFRPRLLDLFSCAGGAAAGYAQAGFDVTGVDIDPQPNYPFEFVQGDAVEYLAAHGHEYDVIHASPPCQGYLNLGAVNRALGRTYDHPDLIGATRELLVASGKPYIIENVADARKHLIDPVRICGTGLGQPIRRHRLFESNVPLTGVACDHKAFSEPKYWTGWRPNGEHRLSTVVQIYGNAGGREHWPAALGVDWMTAKEMTECVPPSYTRHLGEQLLAGLRPPAPTALRDAVAWRLMDMQEVVEVVATTVDENDHAFRVHGETPNGLQIGFTVTISEIQEVG